MNPAPKIRRILRIKEALHFVDLPDMNLCRMVYLSEASKLMLHPELEAMLHQARKNNNAAGISGMLLHSCGNFIQVLEGDDLIVATLFAKISRDSRHKNIRTLLHKAADHRLFPDWSMELADTDRMRSIDLNRVDKVLLHLRLSSDDAMSDEAQALTLLQEFRLQLMNDAA